MKVSIIIPVYKVEKYIERCLLSALNQTWADIEIILVNDCTPDSSMEVVDVILSTHPRKEIVTIITHEKNQGLSVARNHGIERAVGDYIYFLDSDDYLPLCSIELLIKEGIAHDVDFVIGNYKIEGAYRRTPPLLLETGILPDNESILSTYSRDEWFVMACNKLVKLSFLKEENLYFKENIVHEDDLWSFIMACKAQKAYVVNEVTYYYYLQPNSITSRPALRNLECRVQIIEYLFAFINSSPALKENRYVYILFENLKAKYFDRIIYFVRDTTFHYNSYLIFRDKNYMSPYSAYCRFYPEIKMNLRNIHYLLPNHMGYVYYKAFVKICYIFLILPIKLRYWFGKIKSIV